MAKAKNPAPALYQVNYYALVNLPSVTFNPFADAVKVSPSTLTEAVFPAISIPLPAVNLSCLAAT